MHPYHPQLYVFLLALVNRLLTLEAIPTNFFGELTRVFVLVEIGSVKAGRLYLPPLLRLLALSAEVLEIVAAALAATATDEGVPVFTPSTCRACNCSSRFIPLMFIIDWASRNDGDWEKKEQVSIKQQSFLW